MRKIHSLSYPCCLRKTGIFWQILLKCITSSCGTKYVWKGVQDWSSAFSRVEFKVKGHVAHFTISCEILTFHCFLLTIIFSLCCFPLNIFIHDSEELMQSLKLLDCKLETQHFMKSKYVSVYQPKCCDRAKSTTNLPYSVAPTDS